MSELQSDDPVVDNDEYIEEVNESEEAEIQEDDSESSDLATDSDAEHEEKTESQIAAEKTQEVINRKHWEAKENERKYLAAQKELEQYKAQQQETAPEIPELPDPFDDDYEARLRSRDEAMKKRYEWEAQQGYSQQIQQQKQQEAQDARAKEVYDKQMSYAKRASEYGIKEQELQEAGNKIANYGLNVDLQVEILADKDGPLLTKHLAANPMELEQLTSMNPYAAARYIESLRPKLQALKPRKTNTPNPSTRVDGKSTDPDSKRYKNIAGAKFE